MPVFNPPPHSTTGEAAAYWHGVRNALDQVAARAGEHLTPDAKRVLADLYVLSKTRRWEGSE
jgi:hypothetical protein